MRTWLGCPETLRPLHHPFGVDTGAGSALLNACGDVALLWVLEGNVRGRAFYERRGFAPDGARKVLDMGEPVMAMSHPGPD